jgi:hypothetical protein
MVNLVDDKPNTATEQYRHNELLSRQVPVWYPQSAPVADVQRATHTFIVRTSKTFPFDEIHDAVWQILNRYSPSLYSFLALGASPKPIKWVMRRQGVDVVAFSVSKVAANVPVTDALLQKLQLKLAKIVHNNIVVLDYTHSGEGLVVIKRLVAQHWKRGIVAAVSLGRGPDMKAAFIGEIDYFVQGTPNLTTCFENNTFKKALGRAKPGLTMSSYPNENTGRVLDVEKDRYAVYKAGFGQAANLPPIDLDTSVAEELMQTANPRSDDDSEEYEW